MKNYFFRYPTFFLYSLFTLIIVFFLWGFRLKIGIPLAAIITIVLIGYGVVLYFRLLKKYRIQLLLFLLAVTTGFYGFEFLSIYDYSILNSLYSMFKLFILDIDPVFSKTNVTNYPLAIEIARWSAAAYTISTLFSLVYIFFNQSIKLVWYRILGKHIVISGYHKRSKTLIEDLRKLHKKVVLLTEEISETQRTYLQDLGVIVLIGKQGLLYNKAKTLKAEYFIIFNEEDSKNLNEILALNQFIKDSKSPVKLKQVILHLEYHQSFDLFEELERELTLQEKISVKPFNINRLVAEKLFNEYPLYENYQERLRDPEGLPLHLLFIGFGQTGQQLALQAMERSHFMNVEKLEITVLDKEAEKVRKEWYDNYPKINKVVNFHFRSLNTEIESVFHFFNQSSVDYTHVFVCLREDFKNLMEGIELAKKIPHIPVFLKLSEEAQISQWLHTNTKNFKNLYLFGNHEAILNYDYVVNDRLEDVAKAVHEGYQKSKGKESKQKQPAWEELSTFLKESNRNQLNHAEVKLMLLGFKAVKKDKAVGLQIVTPEDFKEAAENQIEQIARSEHQRWNTFYYLKGWDVLETMTKAMPRDSARKLHGCLVSYKELEDIYRNTGEDYREYDREVVRKLYETIRMAGFEIVKS